MSFDSTIIVCQGNFEYDYHKPIVEEYKDFSNVVFSTWDEHRDFLIRCGVSEDKIITSSKPTNYGHSNANLQFKSSYFGVEYGKNRGFDFALKIRSDLLIKKNDIVELIESMDNKLIYFPAWHNHNGGYLCEHLIFGGCVELANLFSIFEEEDPLFLERRITNKYLEYKYKLGYIFPILYDKRIDCYWTKRNFYLNEYKNDKLFVYEYYLE